jgi:hypothetical protein
MATLAEFGTGELLWSMLWFTLFFIWIWILISCFMDIFRSHDIGGWGKALWVIFIIVLPYLGVFVYLIARGKGMQERSMKQMADAQAAQAAYIKSVAGSAAAPSAADEIARLTELKEKGAITEDEFNALKAKAISG